MFDSINLSKFLVPNKQKGFLHRARLIDWMHENVHRKLTFVSAPAGYGKTSLLLDFASDVDVRVCWYLVTQGDRDLRRFAWDLILSFRQVYPDFGREIEGYLKTNQGRFDPVSLAIDFINDALRTIDDYTLLFLDDYHMVAESDEVTGFFELFLDYLPDGIRIVLASRTEFGIPTGKLYARNQINLMNVDQLRFRPEELQQLVARAYRLKLSNEEAAELARRSDGWIVAVMLAAKSLKRGSIVEFQGSAEHVYSFLAQEVIEREAQDLQNFMLAISVVEEFNSEIAGRLVDGGHADGLIRELEWRNLFVTRIETNEGRAYRFHQLFLDFLRHRLSALHPAWKNELHRRAAGWYEENRDWERAINQYLDLGDRTSAARLMDYVAKHYFVYGENLRVEYWLEILRKPPDLRAESPELVLNRAKHLVDQNQLAEAETLLEISESVFEQTGSPDKILNGLSVRGLIHLRRGRFEEALQVVQRAREILAGPIDGDLYIARPQQFDRIETLYHLWQGRRDEGLERLVRVVSDLHSLQQEAANPVVRDQVTHDLVLGLDLMGWIHYQAGKIYEGQKYYLEALEYREKYLRNNQSLVDSLNSIGYIYFQIGDFEKAYRYLKQASQVAETVEKGQAIVHLYNSWADLLRELDDWDAAENYILAALKLGADSSVKKKALDNSGTYQAYSRLERMRGNFDKAIYYLHESIRLNGRPMDSPEFQSRLGAIYYSMGQLDLAIASCSQALEHFGTAGAVTQDHATAAYLLGCAYFRTGRTGEAIAYLKKALEMTAVMGFDQFIIAEGRRSIAFLELAEAALPESGQVRSILKRVRRFRTGVEQFDLPPETGAVEAERIHLEVFGFGVGRILVNGESVNRSDWRANMAKALFFYILDGQGDTGPAIKLQFWPDKSGAKATSNFQSTLWRARKALGGLNVIVLEDNRYRIAREAAVWYDVEEFENRLEKARDPAVSESERLDLLKSAVELYTGDYLEDIFMEWSVARSGELQHKYLAALETLGGSAFERGRFDEAAQMYERILRVDPYRDDAELAILKCMVRTGATVSAAQRYQRYANFLAEEGLVPSEELKSFYQQISVHPG